MSFESQSVAAPRPIPVRTSDRVWDVLALAFLTAGILFFIAGRASLGSLASETYDVPPGVSWLSRAEHHDAQTRWGAWLIGAGLVVGTAAAGRHALARRRIPR
jgi:hypothetical protein